MKVSGGRACIIRAAGWVCLAVPALCALPGVCAAAMLQAGSAAVEPGHGFSLSLTLARSDVEPVAAFQCDFVFDPARFVFLGAAASAALIAAGKSLQAAELSAGRWRIVVFGFNQTLIPPGETATLSMQARPEAAAGLSSAAIEQLKLSGPNAEPIAGSGANGTITVGAPRYHSADTNRDLQFSLAELLRGIQLFNAFQFYCDGASEDGYTIFPSDRACAPHSSDYRDGPDWRISLTELLRLIQLFNVRGYLPSLATEDGFEAAAR